MKRRDFIKSAGAAGVHLIAGPVILTTASIARAQPFETSERLRVMRDLYSLMRPHVSGQSYVNYRDLDLPDGPAAYWGENLQRLMQIKNIFDPKNVFQHAQSVPLNLGANQ